MARIDSLPERFPRRLFIDGVLRFPFAPGMRTCCAGMAIWLFSIQWLAWTAEHLTSDSEAGVYFGRAMLMVMVCFGAMFGAGLVSAVGLAVVRDTASGCNCVHSWPSFSMLDWFFEALFIFDAMCASVLPGVAVGWASAKCGVPDVVSGLLMWFFAYFLFPIFLMSMLETNSPFGAFSASVWQTVRIARKGWLAFYAATAVLFAAMATVCVSAVLLVAHGGRFGLWTGVALVSAAVAVGWLLYFRMFGKLAGYCTERMEAENAEDEENEEEECELKLVVQDAADES